MPAAFSITLPWRKERRLGGSNGWGLAITSKPMSWWNARKLSLNSAMSIARFFRMSCGG